MTSPTPVWRWGNPVEPLRELLDRGGVLAIPTESSYGLGADPWNQAGFETIYRIKHRERGRVSDDHRERGTELDTDEAAVLCMLCV